MSTWHVSNEVRNKIASTGPLGQAWLDELARDTSGDVDGHPAMTADVEEVEVVVAHQERITLRVGDVVAGYGTDVDLDVVRGWWSLRCLLATRWLVEHGYGPAEEYPEVALLRSQP